MGYNCYTYDASGFPRRFVSKAERAERLKTYQDALEKELQAVKERIDELTT